MLATLLEGENPGYSQYIMLGIVVLLIVVIAVFYFLTNKKRKKQEQDAQDLINAVKPGNKVKTIGGICGIVVEVDNEENTFVLETGTELSGKSYIKFDRKAIYQTDAVVDKKLEAKEDPKEEVSSVSETVVEEQTETAPVVTEEVAAEVKEEVVAEETATKPEMVKSKKKDKNNEEEKQIKF